MSSYISPGHIILVTMLTAIAIGTGLLALPIARTQPIPFIDLLFTATSSACVAGHFTVPLSAFSFWGQAIILALIQIGGIGLVTTTLIFLYLFLNIGLGASVRASQLLEIESWKDVRQTLLFVGLITIVCELIGTIIFFFVIKSDFSNAYHPFFFSLFHAVSSFCNAGVALGATTLQTYWTNIIFTFTTAVLMLAGGLGFITWYEIIKKIDARIRRKRSRFSLQSRIILKKTLYITFATMALYLILEWNNTLKDLTFLHSLYLALFHAVSFKSSGFVIGSLSLFQPATICILMLCAFIGAAPVSTGSGVKVTTFTIVIAALKAALLNRDSVEIHKRTIPTELVYRSIAIVLVGIVWITLCTLLLLILEPSLSLGAVIFESFNTFTNLGATLNDVKLFSVHGKMISIMSMIIGRIGLFTLLLSLKLKKTESREFLYPEERVMLG